MGGAVRILQVGDLHLNQICGPVRDLPSDLLPIVTQHRFKEAERAFQLAVRERTNLLLFTESPLGLVQDPLAAWFLIDQLRRLDVAGIEVVWAGCARSDLPEWFVVPTSLRFLPDHHSMGFRLTGTSITIEMEWANLSGDQQSAGQTGDLKYHLHQGPEGLCVEALVRGHSEPVRYLASCPKSGSDTSAESPCVWLTDWTPGREPVVRPWNTAAVFRLTDTVDVGDISDWSELRTRLQSRMQHHGQTSPGDLVIVDWKFVGCGPLWNELIAPGTTTRLREEMRSPRIVGPAAVIPGNIEFQPAVEQLGIWAHDDGVRIGWEEGRMLFDELRHRQTRIEGLSESTITVGGPVEAAFRRELVWHLWRTHRVA